MPNPILTFHCHKNITLQTTKKTFREAIQFVLDRQEPTQFTPYKMVVENTGKILYFDEDKFKAFLADEISQPEIITDLQCDGIYRNKLDVEISKHDVIDSGALWILKDKKLILVDSDRYLPIHYPDDNFIEI